MFFMNKTMGRWLPPVIYRDLYNLRARVRNLSSFKLVKKNSSLKDTHGADECFVLGSGPSLASIELRKLANKNVISVNNLFVCKGYQEMMSGDGAKYHLAAPLHPPNDREVWRRWLKEMDEKVPSEVRMLFGVNDYKNNAHSLISQEGFFLNNECYYYAPTYYRYSCVAGFNKKHLNLSEPVMVAGTASVYALMYAIYMNFKKIYILGVDHTHVLSKSQDVPLRIYDGATHQKQDIMTDNEDIFRKQANTFAQYKFIRDATNSRIINLSSISLIDFFDYEELESVIR